MLNRIEALAQAARPINDNDWGSDRQIKAENKLFAAIKPLIQRTEWDALEAYCLKATTDEMIDEALRIMRAKFHPLTGRSQ